MKYKKPVVLIILWIARIWGSISLAFMLFFVGAHLIGTLTAAGEPMRKFGSVPEMISFAFFPVFTIIGLGLAFKWEGFGGLVSTAGIIGFHILRPELLFNLMIDGLAFPGLLYILYWFLSLRLINTKVNTA